MRSECLLSMIVCFLAQKNEAFFHQNESLLVNTSSEHSVTLNGLDRLYSDFEVTLRMNLQDENQIPWLTSVFLYDDGPPLTLQLNENRSSLSTLMCFGSNDPMPEAQMNHSLFIYMHSEFEVKVELSIREVILKLEPGVQNRTLKQDHPINFIVTMEADHPGYMIHFETFTDQNHNPEALDPCLIITASQGTCRFFETSHVYAQSDKWLTALQSGTMQIFPSTENPKTNMFISVFISARDVCRKTSSMNYGQITNLRITLSDLKSYDHYICPILFLMGSTGVVCMIAGILVRCKLRCKTFDEGQISSTTNDHEGQISSTSNNHEGQNSSTSDNHIEESDASQEQHTFILRLAKEFKDKSEYKLQALGRLDASPKISSFTYGWAKLPWMKRNRSLTYLVLTPLISLFYFIPSIQFVMLAKDVESLTGSMDNCYHNYYCSKPWFFVDDFNHMISNLPYVIYGLVFVFLVHYKSGSQRAENRGIPEQYSIFYTMGITLSIEGIFSMIYHICPTNFSLQFDTTMLYIMGYLIIVKLYQFRHPDAVVTGYTFYAIIGGILILVTVSLYVTSWIFFSIFLACYILTTLLLALNAYYMGILSLEASVPKTLGKTYLSRGENTQECCGITHIERFWVCLIFFLMNVGLASFALHKKFQDPTEGLTYVVGIILGFNVLLYMVYYMGRNSVERYKAKLSVKKCWNEHFPRGQVFIVFALIFAGLSIHFFRNEHKNRSLTPAESRNLNEECAFMDFFDNHDIWHFCSASAMFMVFLGLLTMDDYLQDIPQDELEVF